MFSFEYNNSKMIFRSLLSSKNTGERLLGRPVLRKSSHWQCLVGMTRMSLQQAHDQRIERDDEGKTKTLAKPATVIQVKT